MIATEVANASYPPKPGKCTFWPEVLGDEFPVAVRPSAVLSSHEGTVSTEA